MERIKLLECKKCGNGYLYSVNGKSPTVLRCEECGTLFSYDVDIKSLKEMEVK